MFRAELTPQGRGRGKGRAADRPERLTRVLAPGRRITGNARNRNVRALIVVDVIADGFARRVGNQPDQVGGMVVDIDKDVIRDKAS